MRAEGNRSPLMRFVRRTSRDAGVVNFFLLLRTFSSSKQRPGDVGISFKQKLLFIENSLLRRCSHPSLTIAQHSRVYTFQGGGIHRGGDNLNKACKCSTGISPLPEFPQP